MANARTIGINGDATGVATPFNGGTNITIPVTLTNSGVTAGNYTLVTVDAKGRVVAGLNPTNMSVNITGNSATATKLQTARTLQLTGDVTGSATYDGSAGTSITTTVINDSHSHTAATLPSYPGTNLWVSGEYTPVANTPTIVTHGIVGLDPLKARVDVVLKCVVAEWEYNAGDFAICWGSRTSENNYRGANAVLTVNNVQINTGKLVAFSKNYGNGGGELTLANWRYIFRIWY